MALCPPAAPCLQSGRKGAAGRYGAGFPAHIPALAHASSAARWRDYDRRQRRQRPAAFPPGRCDNGFFCRVLHNSPLPACLFFWLDNDNISYVFSHYNGRVGGFCARFGVSNNLLRHRRHRFSAIQLRLFINRRGNHFRCVVSTSRRLQRLWFSDSLRLNGSVSTACTDACGSEARYGREMAPAVQRQPVVAAPDRLHTLLVSNLPFP